MIYWRKKLFSGVALGDLQSSVYALLKEPTDAVLNISTSAQLAYVHPSYVPEIVEDIRKNFYEYEKN